MSHLPDSSVYFARCIAPAGDMGALKIGVAKDVDRRLVSVASQMPFSLKLIGAVPGDLFTEFFLHLWLRPQHLGGEFFRAEGEAMRLANAAATDGRLPLPLHEGEKWPRYDDMDWADFMAARGITLALMAQHSGVTAPHYKRIMEGKGKINRRFYAALAVTAVRMGFAVHWPRDFYPQAAPMRSAA